MLPKAHLTSHSRMSGSRWVTTPSWLSGSWRSFLYSSSVYSCHLSLISSVSVRSIPFLSFIVPIFVWNIPLVSLIFLKRSLVFPILLLSSISLYWSLRKDNRLFKSDPCCGYKKTENGEGEYLGWVCKVKYSSKKNHWEGVIWVRDLNGVEGGSHSMPERWFRVEERRRVQALNVEPTGVWAARIQPLETECSEVRGVTREPMVFRGLASTWHSSTFWSPGPLTLTLFPIYKRGTFVPVLFIPQLDYKGPVKRWVILLFWK